jgi:hypothetical protein
MSRTTDPQTPAAKAPSPGPAGGGLQGKIACPFCGSIRELDGASDVGPCPRCAMADNPTTRKATRARIGPWFVRQVRNPAAPGMTYATLLTLVGRGQVTAYSVIRGPTTGQLWRFAAHTRGLSREFGLCHRCGAEIERTAAACPKCGRNQQPPVDPDVLLDPAVDASATTPAQKPVRPAEPSPSQAPVSPLQPGPAPRGGEEILTAEDLAAAFQLELDPNAGRRARLRPRRKAWVPREHGRMRRFALAVALLILSAGSIVLMVNPRWRRAAWESTNAAWASISQRLWTTSDNQVSPAPQAKAVVAPSTAAKPRPAVPASAKAPEPAPTMASTARAAVPTPAEPGPQALATAQPAAERTKADRQPQPLGGSAQDYETARTLWRAALDSEARRDYATAVATYEQIRLLPRKVWPAGLDINLDLARRRIK